MRIRSVQSLLCALFIFTALTAFAAGEKPDTAPRFDIKRYQVEGNTLLSAGKLESILSPFTGRGRDFGAVQEALDALQQSYRGHRPFPGKTPGRGGVCEIGEENLR